MGSLDERTNRAEPTGAPTQRQRSAPKLRLIGLVVGMFALASCGSDAVENGATAGEQPGDDASELLADAQDELIELQESGTLGSGSGVVTVDGVDYSFEAAVCYSHPSGFEASGPGQGADGVPYWVSLSTGISTRQEMLDAGLLKEAVDTFFGDADSMESFGLNVELGKADQFTSGDDTMPEFRIDVIDITEAKNLDYTVDGNSLSGSGTVTDHNGVALSYPDTAPTTFSASCN